MTLQQGKSLLAQKRKKKATTLSNMATALLLPPLRVFMKKPAKKTNLFSLTRERTKDGDGNRTDPEDLPLVNS
jgi:hypothetical protein